MCVFLPPSSSPLLFDDPHTQTFPVGKSDGRASKFKVGFYRRPAHKIAAAAERSQHEEMKESYAAATAQARHDRLSEMNTRNGNVIVPTPIDDAKIFPSRRHFPSRSHEVADQNHARQKVGASRFHIELNSQEEQHRQRTIRHRLEQQKQSTSLLGYGRSDLTTYGVVDNFRAMNTYTDNDLISRPKLKPAPRDIPAAHPPGGGLVLEDGSGYGRRSAAALNPSRLNTSQGAVVGAPPPRKVNRSNQTSSAFADAFKYDHVDTWNRAGSHRRDLSSMPPAGSKPVAPQPSIFANDAQN